MENCEIYITGVVYNNNSWINDIDQFLQEVYNQLNEIRNFRFISLCATESQVYNVGLKETNYESMIIYIKGAKYKNSEFLNLYDTQELEFKMKEQLNNIENLSFNEIEIRTSKSFLDINLGIIEKPVKNLGPVILESN